MLRALFKPLLPIALTVMGLALPGTAQAQAQTRGGPPPGLPAGIPVGIPAGGPPGGLPTRPEVVTSTIWRSRAKGSPRDRQPTIVSLLPIASEPPLGRVRSLKDGSARTIPSGAERHNCDKAYANGGSFLKKPTLAPATLNGVDWSNPAANGDW